MKYIYKIFFSLLVIGFFVSGIAYGAFSTDKDDLSPESLMNEIKILKMTIVKLEDRVAALERRSQATEPEIVPYPMPIVLPSDLKTQEQKIINNNVPTPNEAVINQVNDIAPISPSADVPATSFFGKIFKSVIQIFNETEK